MNCLVTAGPTIEPLDQVRRLTNRSTGRLGCALAAYLAEHGHRVTLLLAEQAIALPAGNLPQVLRFETTADLRALLEKLAGASIQAVFHAAAVSDFRFRRVWTGPPDGPRTEVRAGKIPTAHDSLWAELTPTPKLIAHLRAWFPHAWLVGWKYEVDGGRAQVIEQARRQITTYRTDLCVANGPAYGQGFGVVQAHGEVRHCADAPALFRRLEQTLPTPRSAPQAGSPS